MPLLDYLSIIWGAVQCIIYHLLMKREDYREPDIKKNKPKIPIRALALGIMDIHEMIKIINQEGYLVKKKNFRRDAGNHPILFT